MSLVEVVVEAARQELTGSIACSGWRRERRFQSQGVLSGKMPCVGGVYVTRACVAEPCVGVPCVGEIAGNLI